MQRLATDGLDVFQEYLGDHYRELNDQLNAELRGSASETSPQEALQNREMLDNIVGLFPGQKAGGVEANSVAEVRWLQSSVVWLNVSEFQAMEPEYVASYIVGIEQKHKWPLMRILLHGLPLNYEAKGKDAQQGFIREVKVVKNGFLRQYRAMRSKPTEVMPESEMNKLYSEGVFHLSEDTKGSVKLQNAGPTDWLPIGPRVAKVGVSEPLNALSDNTLAIYNVFDHVYHLANAFDKVNEVRAIIANAETTT